MKFANNCTIIAALLMSYTVPIEVWAGVELYKGILIIAFPLIALAAALNFAGIITWIGAQAREIEEDLKKDGAR
jgi:hypothetical protein